MVYLIVGLPSPFTEWCARMAVDRLALRERRAELCWVTDLRSFARFCVASSADDILCVCPTFEEELGRALVQSSRGPLVLMDDPFGPLCAMIERGDAPLEAMRYLTACCASVATAATEMRATCLSAADCRRDAQSAGAAIETWLGGDGGVAETVAFDGDVAAEETAARLDGLLGDPALAAALREVFALYPVGEFAAHRRGMRLTGRVLRRHGGEAGFADGPIDVTGGARLLVSSGFIYLPPGEWDATLTLEMDEAATECVYHLEFFGLSGAVLGHVQFQAGAPGLHRVALPLRLPSLTAAVDFRLHTLRPAFDGSLVLRSLDYRLRR